MDYSQLDRFTRHGGAYDRGSADAYYQRGQAPHYYAGDSYSSAKIEAADMSAEELAAYEQGYQDQVRSGEFKVW